MTERKRRHAGEGSARPRHNGWQVRYLKRTAFIKGHTSRTEISRWRSSGAIPKEVREKLNELISRVEQGTETSGGKVAFETYISEQWLPHHRAWVRPATYTRDEQLLRVHVLPVIGHMRLGDVRPVDVQRVVDTALASGVTPATAALAYRALASALAGAVRLQVLAVNHAKGVRPPRVPRAALAVPDRDQTARIIDICSDSWIATPVLLAASTGMRLSETLGLTWGNTDLDTGIVRVVHAIEWDRDPASDRRTGRTFRFSEPKSSRGRRTISLPPFTVDALRRLKREQNERRLVAGQAWVDLDLVVDDGVGGPLRMSSVSAAFATKMRRAEIERVRFHDLRHAFATRLLEAGVHPKVVSEALGHSSVAITLDTYSHVTPTMGEQVAAAIEEALGPR